MNKNGKLSFLFVIIVVFTCKYSYSTITPVGLESGSFIDYLVINSIHNKLYAVNVTNKTLLSFDLYPDSGALVSSIALQMISNCTFSAMALDVMKKKLYVGGGYGEVLIYNLSDSGLIITPPTYYALSAYPHTLWTMHIDFVHNYLVYSASETTYPTITNSIGVVQLGNDGLPSSPTAKLYTYTYGTYTYPKVMAEDVALGRIYRGNSPSNGYAVGNVMRLDASGNPDTLTNVVNPYGGSLDAVYDAPNKRIYFVQGDGSPLTMWRLSDAGDPTQYDTSIINNYLYNQWSGLAIDPTKRKLITAGWKTWDGAISYYTLDSNGLPSTIFDSGNASIYLTCMGYEPFYNNVYLGRTSGNGISVYIGPDSALNPIKINDGESLTETPSIILHFQCANPNFMYVSGDLLSISSPVNNVGQWVSCGGGFWKNTGDTLGAQTLNVSAVLSSGVGEKTIEVWYCGSTTHNYTGQMRKANAKITLIESSAVILSAGISRIDYSGARIDYVAKDGRGRNVNVSIQYRTSDKEWTNATEGSDASEGGANSEGKTNLTATLAGVNHYFIWDIEKDIPAGAREVQIRLKADNGDSSGVWFETSKYSVPEWTGSDLRVINVSIKKAPGTTGADGTWAYRARLEWSGLSDTTTTYEIQKKEDDGAWSFIGTLTGTLIEVENLSETPVYSFRVRLRTKEGLFSEYSKSVSIKLTQRQYTQDVVGKSGGKISIEDFDENDANNASVEIEEGTFREDATVTFERYTGDRYEINGKKSSGIYLIENDFKKAVTLKLAYNREEIAKLGWQEDGLSVFYFDGINWISIGGKVDKTNSLVIVKVKHFSLYKISKNLDKPVVQVPVDYFSPNGDGIQDVLNFYFTTQLMVEKNEIKIYNMDGKLLNVIKSDGTNTIFWNGRDANGSLCETGLYVCVIETEGKRLTKTVSLVK